MKKNKAGTGDREEPGRRWEATLFGLKQHLSRPEGWKEPDAGRSGGGWTRRGMAGGKALRGKEPACSQDRRKAAWPEESRHVWPEAGKPDWDLCAWQLHTRAGL